MDGDGVYVFLSAANQFTSECFYKFPTAAAAHRFADAHRRPGRAVYVQENPVSKSGHHPREGAAQHG